MEIHFLSRAAQVSGGKAPILVRCTGSVADGCVGTLTLRIHGKTYKKVYTVASGKKKKVAVPLGGTALDSGGSVRAAAIASTSQPSGKPVKTRHTLTIR
jgi:hypothetical protein